MRYWTLLADIICSRDRATDARPLKTWLGAILARVPIAPIVLSFLGSYIQNDDMSKAVAACLSTLWPLGVQKTSTETLLECLGASLPLINEHRTDEGLAKIASLVVNSYRNSVSNHSNKKKVCDSTFAAHFYLTCGCRFVICFCSNIYYPGWGTSPVLQLEKIAYTAPELKLFSILMCSGSLMT